MLFVKLFYNQNMYWSKNEKVQTGYALSKCRCSLCRYVASSQRSSQSTALSRLALIEDRIRNRQQARDGPPSSAPNRGSTPGPTAQETPLSLSAQSSSDLSMKGKRFLKTKTPTTTATTLATAANAPTVAPKGPEASFKAATPLGGSKASQLAAANRGVTLDSDEEDMRQLLGGSFESPEDSLLTDLRGASQNIPRKVDEICCVSLHSLSIDIACHHGVVLTKASKAVPEEVVAFAVLRDGHSTMYNS